MIQINPLQSYIDGGARAAITSPPSASLVFDLPGKAIWVKGVKLKGIDHTYTFSHDNYITLTNTPDQNNPESEDIKIGVNITALKNVIDTTYNVVTASSDGLAPAFSNGNKATTSANTTYHFLGLAGTTLKWYELPHRNIYVETTEVQSVSNIDPLKFAAGDGIEITWDSTNKKIVITNSAPDLNHNTDFNVQQTPKTDNVNRPLMMINGGTSAGELTSTSMFSTGIYANASSKMITANGFVKADSDDTSVLLAGGGAKALTDFAMAHSHPYLPLSGGTLSNTAWGAQLTLKRLGGTPSLYFDNGTDKFCIYPIGNKDNEWHVSTVLNGGTEKQYILYHTGNLPPYPTKASWNYDDRYLQLTGGTITNGSNWATIAFRRTGSGYGDVGGLDGNGLYFYHKLEDESKSINMYLKAGDGLRVGGVLVSLNGHTHDDRYYTETETDNRYVKKSGDDMSGALSFTGMTGAVTSGLFKNSNITSDTTYPKTLWLYNSDRLALYGNSITLNSTNGTSIEKSTSTPNLFVINDSSDSTYDAMVYFRNRGSADWAQVIDTGDSNTYGLDIRSSGNYAFKVAGKSRFLNPVKFGANSTPSDSYAVDVAGKIYASNDIEGYRFVLNKSTTRTAFSCICGGKGHGVTSTGYENDMWIYSDGTNSRIVLCCTNHVNIANSTKVGYDYSHTTVPRGILDVNGAAHTNSIYSYGPILCYNSTSDTTYRLTLDSDGEVGHLFNYRDSNNTFGTLALLYNGGGVVLGGTNASGYKLNCLGTAHFSGDITTDAHIYTNTNSGIGRGSAWSGSLSLYDVGIHAWDGSAYCKVKVWCSVLDISGGLKVGTSRKIWGNTFDFSADVTGTIYKDCTTGAIIRDSSSNWILGKDNNSTGTLSLGSAAVAQPVWLNNSAGSIRLLANGNSNISGSLTVGEAVYDENGYYITNSTDKRSMCITKARNITGGGNVNDMWLWNGDNTSSAVGAAIHIYPLTYTCFANGNVKISSDRNVAPTHKLEVAGEIYSTGSVTINGGSGWTYFGCTRSGNGSSSIGGLDGAGVYFSHTLNSTTYYMYLKAGTGLTLYTGNMYAPNFYTTSDVAKKKNISSFSEHIRKFQLKDTEKWHYGVIALEVPEMFRDGEEGNMTVNYNSILSFYIGQLENKVKILEERIRILESK